MNALAQGKRHRAGIKGSLIVLSKDLDEILETTTRVEVEAKLHSVQTQVAMFEANEDVVLLLYTSDTEYFKENQEDAIYLFDINEIISSLKEKFGKSERHNRSEIKKGSGVKLPHLTLPTFAGESTLWTGFWDMLRCVVHDRADISVIQKQTYLRGQLQGDAYKLVEGFTVEGASYAPAVDMLQETFGHPDRARAAHIMNFHDLVSPKCQAAQLKAFYANMESAMRSINSQRVSLEELCVVTLLNKLSSPVNPLS